jgi:hypothetical protein
MTSRMVTRFEAVRDQINSAIRVFFLWDDLVSAITLAGAAERVLSDLQPQDGIFGIDAHSIRSMVNLYIKQEHQKEAGALFRRDYDLLRHADRDSTKDHEIKESKVTWLIFLSICAFEFLKQKKTMEMKAFFWWFFATHPQYLKADAPDLATIMKIKLQIAGLSKRQYYLAFAYGSQGKTLQELELMLRGDNVYTSSMIVRAPAL